MKSSLAENHPKIKSTLRVQNQESRIKEEPVLNVMDKTGVRKSTLSQDDNSKIKAGSTI